MSNRSIMTPRRSLPNFASDLWVMTRAAFGGAPRWLRDALPFVAWAVVAVVYGGVVGFASIILPPTGALGLVAVAGLVLLWVTPDLARVPTKSLRVLFFISLAVNLCVPNYYAYQIPGLPWISVRRLAAVPLIVVFAVALAGSCNFRARLTSSLDSLKSISIGVIGFLVMIFLSIFTSASFTASISGVVDAILIWFLPFFATIYVMRNEEDLFKFVRIIGWCALLVSCVGVLEFITHHRIALELMPGSLRASLLASNPSFALIENANPYRNGEYRSSSIFGVPLCFAEFAAMVAPFGYAMCDSRRETARQSSRLRAYSEQHRGDLCQWLSRRLCFVSCFERLVRRALVAEKYEVQPQQLGSCIRVDIARRWIFGHYSTCLVLETSSRYGARRPSDGRQRRRS